MSGAARERLRISIGLSAEQFRVGSLFLAAYQKKHRHSLAVHAGYERAVFGEPGAARLQ